MFRAIKLAFVGAIALTSGAAAQTDQQAAAIAHNRELGDAVIARDHVQNVFVTEPTATGVVWTNRESQLVCAGDPEKAHLQYIPPHPNIITIGCITTIDEANIGPLEIQLRAMRLTPGAQALVAQMSAAHPDQPVVDILLMGQASAASIRADSFHAQPWSGPVAEVGSGGPSPIESRRYQGQRDGAPIYYRYSWARVGDWVYSGSVIAPLDKQMEAETVLGILFSTQVIAIQARAASAAGAPPQHQP